MHCLLYKNVDRGVKLEGRTLICWLATHNAIQCVLTAFADIFLKIDCLSRKVYFMPLSRVNGTEVHLSVTLSSGGHYDFYTGL